MAPLYERYLIQPAGRSPELRSARPRPDRGREKSLMRKPAERAITRRHLRTRAEQFAHRPVPSKSRRAMLCGSVRRMRDDKRSVAMYIAIA